MKLKDEVPADSVAFDLVVSYNGHEATYPFDGEELHVGRLGGPDEPPAPADVGFVRLEHLTLGTQAELRRRQVDLLVREAPGAVHGVWIGNSAAPIGANPRVVPFDAEIRVGDYRLRVVWREVVDRDRPLPLVAGGLFVTMLVLLTAADDIAAARRSDGQDPLVAPDTGCSGRGGEAACRAVFERAVKARSLRRIGRCTDAEREREAARGLVLRAEAAMTDKFARTPGASWVSSNDWWGTCTATAVVDHAGWAVNSRRR